MVLIKKQDTIRDGHPENQGQQWDNPSNPENAADERDLEQLKRQKKDVDQKNENLTEKPKN